MSIDDILNFLKGFVPGYAAIENAVAPVFGSDVNDYGQCRAICGSSPGAWPAAITTCNTCCDKIASDAVLKLLPELAGAGATGLALGLTQTVLWEAFKTWLEKKGLTWLLERAIPVFGWICLIGDIANILSILISLKRVWDAVNAAKKTLCVCP